MLNAALGLRRLSLLALGALGASSAASCAAFGKNCTEIGCIDGAGITVQSKDGTWQDGNYTLTVQVADSTHTCTLTLPQDSPPLGTVREVPCEPALGFPGVSFNQEAECHEERSEDSVSQVCNPIPGHYSWQIGLSGTPANVIVALARDGEALLEENLQPQYQVTRPNGEGCEPVCRQASLTLTAQ